jgi:hypothetical protein
MTTARKEQQVRAVLAELAKGATNQQVAQKLGLTRNTVIGIAYRHGERGQRRTKAQANNERRARERIAERREKRPEPPKPVRQPKAVIKPVKPGGIPLEALTLTSCRWPITDNVPHRFCGCKATDGPYCPDHTEMGRAGQ